MRVFQEPHPGPSKEPVSFWKHNGLGHRECTECRGRKKKKLRGPSSVGGTGKIKGGGLQTGLRVLGRLLSAEEIHRPKVGPRAEQFKKWLTVMEYW